MNRLEAVRDRLWLVAEHEPPLPRLGIVAVTLLLLIALVVGVGEMRLLLTYSADDVNSILFQAG